MALLTSPGLLSLPDIVVQVAPKEIGGGHGDIAQRTARALLRAGSGAVRFTVIVSTGSSCRDLEADVVINCWTDFRGWLNQDNAGSLKVDQILRKVQLFCKEQSSQVRLVFPELSSILQENSAHSVARFTKSISSIANVEQVVYIYQRQTYSNDKARFLSHLKDRVSGSVLLSPSESNSHALDCHVRYKVAKGKPSITKSEVIRLSADGSVAKVSAAEGVVKPVDGDKAQQAETEDEREALSKLTTFNLGLKSVERDAREKVVLPFWKEEQKGKKDDPEEEEAVRIQPKTSSKIYYEPDEADDWDDEDPDDDLDF